MLEHTTCLSALADISLQVTESGSSSAVRAEVMHYTLQQCMMSLDAGNNCHHEAGTVDRNTSVQMVCKAVIDSHCFIVDHWTKTVRDRTAV